MREPKPKRAEPFATAFNLTKTVAPSIIIVAFIIFIAMFYCLHKAYSYGDKLQYYLPWCLIYGVPALGLAIIGVYGSTRQEKIRGQMLFVLIAGVVASAFCVAGSIPLLAVWGNLEFFFSGLAIAACCLVISILGLVALNQAK